jgi:hypothetical protein
MPSRHLCLGALVLLLLIAVPPQFAAAQHGGWSFGGGGFGGMRSYGGHQYRQSYGHNNYNYNRSYGHNNYNYGHSYRQPAQQYVPPRTNIIPRSQAAPQRTYVAPKTNVVPRQHVAPPASKPAVATKVTPRPNSIGTLAPSSHPTPPAARTPVASAPAANSLPAVNKPAIAKTATAKPKPKQPVKANPGRGHFVADLKPSDLKSIADQIGKRDQQKLGGLKSIVIAGTPGLTSQLPNAADLTAAQQGAINDAVASGNPARVAETLGPAAAASPAGMGLGELAAALDAIGDMIDAIADGNFGGDDLARLINVTIVLDLPPAGIQGLLATIGDLAIDQQVIVWILDTDPGMGIVPFGDDIPIVLVPGLPDGLLMPLDGGVVMIGMGAPGDGLMLGMGDPLEVAGLPVPIEGAEPAAATTASFAAGQIILANPTTETVNYNLNQQPYSMAPTFEQTLPAGTAWTIEFDRGGGFGMARYELSEGYYVFAATERGWELYKRTFTTSLDNSANSFAFNYVIDEQQQTLNPGETHDLNGVFPPIVRFDNGSGQEQSRRLESGAYSVAVADNLTIDIYRAEDVTEPQAPQPAPSGLVAVAPTAAPVAVRATAPAAAPAVEIVPAAPVVRAPMPVPSTVRAVTGAPAASPTGGRRLPAGFTLFDPVPALTDARVARQLPASFTLFRSAAEQMVVAPRQ